MQIKIKSFGIARDILGGRDTVLELKGTTVGDLRNELFQLHESLGKLNSLFIAVNQKYADEQTVVQPNDEIALIPPVAGG